MQCTPLDAPRRCASSLLPRLAAPFFPYFWTRPACRWPLQVSHVAQISRADYLAGLEEELE